MTRGLFGTRRKERRWLRITAPTIIASLLLATAATSAFVWNRYTASGTLKDARNASWLGDLRERRQAITFQSDALIDTIENFKRLRDQGDEQSRKLAQIALDRATKHLDN